MIEFLTIFFVGGFVLGLVLCGIIVVGTVLAGLFGFVAGAIGTDENI